MIRGKRVTCVVPARLHSTRFPKKVLAQLGRQPLLQWVYEAALGCEVFDQVVFAIDAKETAAILESFSAPYVMTSADCPSGTQRVVEVAKRGEFESDIWVNWQADEPFVNAQMIGQLLSGEGGDVWTLKRQITNLEELKNPNVVKVVTDRFDRALYFSRSPIPYRREGEMSFYKHVGLYGYTHEALLRIGAFSVSDLEVCEGLEQLTFLYEGLSIQVHETECETIGIDTHRDLLAAMERVS